MIQALAYIPVEHVQSVFKQLEGFVDARLAPVLCYFRNVFIGELRDRHVRGPSFPIAVWNQVQRVICGLPRTNNLVEGFHSGLSQLVGVVHPSLSLLACKLRRVEHLASLEWEGGYGVEWAVLGLDTTLRSPIG